MLETLTKHLAAAGHLTDEQVSAAVEQLLDAAVPPGVKADFLHRLAAKGETIAEITAFVLALRARAILPPLDAETRGREILDVVGTGGDRAGTFNISTTAAILCAAAGVTVAKHGNRAATSRCGSADVLEALGIPIDLTPEAAARALRNHGFAFFFAPSYHPAFKHVAPARKLCAERGGRTIFNLLGPLLNPARPSAVLAGVPLPELCEPLARVLQSLGVRHAMVVCGTVQNPKSAEPNYLDEFSTLGENTIAEFYQERGFTTSVLSDHFTVQPATLDDLAGGACDFNAGLVRAVLRGEDNGPRRDAVLLNAGAALLVAGRTRSITEGWDMAADVIDSGKAARKLEQLQSAA